MLYGDPDGFESYNDMFYLNTTSRDVKVTNFDKLNSYLRFSTLIRVRKDGASVYHKVPMKMCKEEWGKKIHMSPKMLEEFINRICPDLDYLWQNEIWQLHGTYDSPTRTSFASVVEACVDMDGCKRGDEVDAMLKRIYMTEYMIKKETYLYNVKNPF